MLHLFRILRKKALSRLIIVFILLFPINGIFSGLAHSVSMVEAHTSSLLYDREDFSFCADEPAFVEEVEENEEAVLFSCDCELKRHEESVVSVESRPWEDVGVLQINALFYTNLPPPVIFH